MRPGHPYEASLEEKPAVLDYARKLSWPRHRELAWRIADEAPHLTPSMVHHLLNEANLVRPWKRRA
jgi:hypothetical protein